MIARVRQATPADEDAVATLAVAMLAETRPHEPYEVNIIRARFRHYLDAEDAAVWVAERSGKVIAFLLGYSIPFDWRAGCCTVVRMQYPISDEIGSGAPDMLERKFVSWSRKQGAEEIVGLNFDPKRTAAVRDLLGSRKIEALSSADEEGPDNL